MEPTKELQKIKKDVLNCKKCPLYKTRILPVIGEGNHRAKIVFVGEAPGLNEAKTGRPFCGAAGKILDELLNSVGIERKEVYIINLLKDRPPNNRAPEKEEIRACAPYLERQIKIINPEVICSLGRFSMHFLMEKFGLENKIEPISKIHGKVFRAINLFQEIKIVPLFHPAAALYNPNLKKVMKKDFKFFKKLANLI